MKGSSILEVAWPWDTSICHAQTSAPNKQYAIAQAARPIAISTFIGVRTFWGSSNLIAGIIGRISDYFREKKMKCRNKFSYFSKLLPHNEIRARKCCAENVII